ncbi:unnamed protein product [Lepeophtheirus salmonis]|uniref:(salmon louse) hypothetical protein n=1 Tax=Lepeophtheirus salmonis TaxID=72036 RepID=A0A7R8CKX2_LEPSM|nr:unnamed protein product [Lepeophtheirus salmonis]CAF2848874.1 unnamed protein product [Lepeophtheirus salmonis]
MEQKWEVSSSNIVIGRAASHNVIKDAPAPTSYAKRRVGKGDTISAFSLFIDKFIIATIIECTHVEARSKISNADWSTSTEEIYGLLGVIYTRELLAKEQPVYYISTSGLYLVEDVGELLPIQLINAKSCCPYTYRTICCWKRSKCYHIQLLHFFEIIRAIES